MLLCLSMFGLGLLFSSGLPVRYYVVVVYMYFEHFVRVCPIVGTLCSYYFVCCVGVFCFLVRVSVSSSRTIWCNHVIMTYDYYFECCFCLLFVLLLIMVVAVGFVLH